MAQRPRPDDDQDDPLELTPDMEADEPPEDEPPEDDQDDADEAGDGDDADEGEAPADDEGDEGGEPEIGFADDDQAQDENSVIRSIRQRNRDLARENSELRRAQQARPQIDLGPKPTLADCDYDEERYEAALDGWKDREAQVRSAQAAENAQAEQANREWVRDLEAHASQRNQLGLADFDEVIEPVKAALSLPQQAVIVKAAQDSAAFSYALGKSDARLAELAKIHDPIKFAAAVVRMEGGLKVTRKRKAPAPDRPAKGSARLPGTQDKQLDKLEAEAERTGNRTPVIQYKKKLAARSKK